MRILITNLSLSSRSGTETYVRDLAVGLLRRGHAPVVYCTDAGAMAEELLRATVPVVTRLEQLAETPDVIHGHHSLETMAAMCHFPQVPGLFVLHDWSAWHDTPPVLPRLLRYVAVDDCCRDRLTARHGIDPGRVRVLLNAVDLKRFARREPLPSRPRKALVFSNYASRQTSLGLIETACRQRDIQLDAVGLHVGSSSTPEAVLREYDLVFAKGRCAIEALAVGAAVVLCDVHGLGPLVTRGELPALRRLNFGRRTLSQPITVAGLVREIDRYDAADAQAVCDEIRPGASLETLLDDYLDLYEEIIAEHQARPAPSLADELQAAAAGLQWWADTWVDLYRQAQRQGRPSAWSKWKRSLAKRIAKVRKAA